MAKVNIYDEIEYRGEWWVFGDEDNKVNGVLKCSKENQVRLELAGDLHCDSLLMKSNSISDFPTVLGECFEGVVTLLYCRGSWAGSRHNFLDGTAKKRVTMVFEFAIFGEQYESVENINFPKIVAEFSTLKYWMDQAPITVDTFPKFEFIEHSVRELNVRIEQYSLQVSSIYSLNDVSDEYETAGIKYTYYILFEPDEPQSLEWYLNVINKFKRLLSIYTDTITYVLSLEGTNHEQTKEISICSIPLPDFKKVTIDRWNHFIISIYNFSDDIGVTLNKWYELDHDDILYTYIGNIPNDQKTIQEKFLGYARVIESLHRLQDKNVQTAFISPEVYEKMIDRVKELFKEEMGNDLWNKVNDSLKYANEYGFQRKIKDVLKTLPNDVKVGVCLNLKPSRYAEFPVDLLNKHMNKPIVRMNIKRFNNKSRVNRPDSSNKADEKR
jgi:hypothetical protein